LWRLITPVLVHGSIAHIGFNMYALFIFGRNLEYQYGHGRFFLLYLLSGFAGNVVSFVLTPNPSLGASTAIFGMLSAQGVFIYRNRRFFGSRARPILSNIIFILGINLVLGLSPMIDNWGHLGGLIGGLVFAWTAGPLWEMRAELQGFRLVDQQEKWQIFMGTLIVFIAFAALAIIQWF
jgi:rhomboid protease GluP